MPEFPLQPSWEWTTTPWGQALRCRPLAALAAHLFTTRTLVLKGGAPGGDAGWQRLAAAMAVTPHDLVGLDQVHGRDVLVATDAIRPAGAGAWGRADAAVSDSSRLALSVRVADCVPALLADRSSGAVGAVHAGWRGTAAGVAGAAIETMTAAFGTNPEDVVVAIGPSIGPCCYRVGDAVVSAFKTAPEWQVHLDRWLTRAPARPPRFGVPGTNPELSGEPALFLDTWAANADQFVAAGVPRGQVHVAGLCTSCHRDLFHSYRVDGARAGRMAAVIRADCGDRGSGTGNL